MSKNIDRMVECPFYICEGEKSITCEGVMNGTECMHKFSNNLAKIAYENKVCCSAGGRKCHHYRNLSVLYERGLKA